jgi:hypothetical protein
MLLLQLPLEEREDGDSSIEPLVMSKHTFLEKYPQPAIIEQSHCQQLITEQQEQQEQKRDY